MIATYTLVKDEDPLPCIKCQADVEHSIHMADVEKRDDVAGIKVITWV